MSKPGRPRRLPGGQLGKEWLTRLWPLPALGVAVAIGLGLALPRLDAAVDDDLRAVASGYLFGGDARAARAVLSLIASSLITVTSLTFSLTVVTLQLASSQYSPRLLRTFARDRYIQVTLALLLATFTYSVTVLRRVRAPESGGPAFVPQLSVTVAYVFALASVVALVVFLAHLARQIRVESLCRDVHADATATMRAVLEEADDGEPDVLDVPEPPATGVTLIEARASGFLTSVDERALLSAAVDAGAIVLLNRFPGDSLIAGTPIAAAWPARRTGIEERGARKANVSERDEWGEGVSERGDRSERPAGRPGDGPGGEAGEIGEAGDGLSEDAAAELAERTTGAVRVGFERTATQDPTFGLRQLVDVAIKALSPGINDPTTAVHALGHTSALLCEAAGRSLGPHLLCDDGGRVRVVLRRPAFADMLELVMTQPRRYGAGDPDVLARLLALLREVAWAARRPDHHVAVTGQLARLRRTIAGQDFDDVVRAGLEEHAAAVEQAVRGRWPLPGRG